MKQIDNRFVKIESASDNKNKGDIVRFSSLLDQKNIVLLGEPGAGKSFLFEAFSNQESAECYTAGNFDAYASTIEKQSTLYIDALDESRNRVSPNQNVLTNLIKCLLPLSLNKFRISCRSADWFGETDLASFKPYFEKQGGYIVVSLLDLKVDECIEIIMHSRAIDEIDANHFISKCHEKEALEFIKTPLGLFMLYDTAHHQGAWPESKFELYTNLSEKLLEEHNYCRQNYAPSTIAPEQLKSMAGKIFSILLISGQSEIALNTPVSSNLPRLTDFDSFGSSELLVLMSTKIFKSTASSQVTYFHRTVAEFLGGQWLAQQINQKKLSLTRILSLMLTDGQPPIELRGLFAWLSCCVGSDEASTFIDVDPLGVLMYGDVSRLTTNTKKRLLNALILLSKQDPYFRRNNWTTSFLGSLSLKELLPHLSKILKNSKNFDLNSLILDILIQGAWHDKMTMPLKEIVSDSNRSLAEQKMAIKALCFKAPSHAFVHEIYRFLLKVSPNSELTINFFYHFYERDFQPEELVLAVKEYLKNAKKQKNVSGALYGLDEKIPDSDLTTILNGISQAVLVKKNDVVTSSVNRNREVHRFYSRILIRRLYLSSTLKVSQLFCWFRTLNKLDDLGTLNEELKSIISWLDEHQPSLILLYKLTLECLSRKNKIDQLYDFSYELERVFNWRLTTENKLGIFILKIKSGKLIIGSPLFDFYYREAFGRSVLESKFRKEYEYLCSLSDTYTQLKVLQEKTTTLPIQVRLKAKREDVKKKNKAQKIKVNNRRDILNNESLIREGKHFAWCQWLGKKYCKGFGKNVGFDEGFKEYFGDLIHPSIAIEGLLNFFKNEISLTYPKRLEEIKNNRYSSYEGLVAGMDIYWNQKRNLNGLDVDELKAIFALACFPSMPTAQRELSHKAWKKKVIENNPDIAANVYWDVISVQVENNNSEIFYLAEFLMETKLIEQKIAPFFDLVSKYPAGISKNRLIDIILALVQYHDDQKALVSLVNQNLLNKKVNKDYRAIWYSLGLMLDFEGCKKNAAIFLKKKKTYVWEFIELYKALKSSRLKNNIESNKIREFAILFVGDIFPESGPPSGGGGWVGEQNLWDASHFVKGLISEIASSSAVKASQVLKKLSENHRLDSYRDFLKHSYVKCLDTIRQNDFNQPSLKETINILESRRPERIDDLLAFTMDVFNEICREVKGGNSDVFKGFWNEDQHGRVTEPKVEESCRDRLLDLMRPYFQPQRFRVEPEAHMHSNKRVDISVLSGTLKLPIEIKRQMHADIWTACENQLERLYAIDPESEGYGVYLVFWYGLNSSLKKHPKNHLINSPNELEKALINLLPEHKRGRLKVVVIDVSGGVA